MHTSRVVIFDRSDFGPSPLGFPDGYCRQNPRGLRLKKDCTAHSIVLDLGANKVKPLRVFSDPWCSSGAHKADGTLVNTGGWNDGYNVVRTVGAGANADWREFPNAPESMNSSRWYASNQILPDNRIVVVGGRRAVSYEFVPRARTEGAHKLVHSRRPEPSSPSTPSSLASKCRRGRTLENPHFATVRMPEFDSFLGGVRRPPFFSCSKLARGWRFRFTGFAFFAAAVRL